MQYFIDPIGAQYSEDKTVLGSIPKGLKRYEIIEGCTILSSTALENGDSLKELVLPASFKILALGDFDYCPNLERLMIHSEELVTVKTLDRGKHFQTIDYADFFNQYPHIKEIYVPAAAKADYSTLLQPIVRNLEEYGIEKSDGVEQYHWYYDFLFYPEQDPTNEGDWVYYMKFISKGNTCDAYLYEKKWDSFQFYPTAILRDCAIEEDVESRKTILKPLTQESQYDLQYSMICIQWVDYFPFEISFYKDGNKHNSYVNAIFLSPNMRNYVISNNGLYENLSLITSEEIKDLKSYVGKDASAYVDILYGNKQGEGIPKRDYAAIKGLIGSLERHFQATILQATYRFCSAVTGDRFDIFVTDEQEAKQYGHELFTLKRIYFIYHILNCLLRENRSMEDACKNYCGLQNDILKMLNLNNLSIDNFEDIQEMFVQTWGMVLQCGVNETGKMSKFVLFVPVNNLSGYNERLFPILSLYKNKIHELSKIQSTSEAIKEVIIIATSCIAKELMGITCAYHILDANGIDRLYIELFTKSDLQSEFLTLVLKNANEHPDLKSRFKDVIEFYFDLKECNKEQFGRQNELSSDNSKNIKNATPQKSASNSGCMLLLSSIIIPLLLILSL